MTDAERSRGLALLPREAWETVDAAALQGRTLFITGATGFVGRWVLAAIAQLNERSALPLFVRALSRSTGVVTPYSAPWLTWVPGDVREFRDDAPADFVLHAALPSTATPAGGETALLDTARRGAKAVVAHAARAHVRRSVVLSSGAVYGATVGPVAESAPLAPLAPDDAYAHAKREVEAIAQAAAGGNHDVVIARLFTCIGYGYRDHEHLAHVSLVADARAGRPLALRGDGSAVRSYLFGADLAVWLLALVSRTGNDTVNVGSDAPLSLLDFARLVARVAGRSADGVQVGTAAPAARAHFVPDISRARATYNLAPWTPVEVAVAQLLGPAVVGGR